MNADSSSIDRDPVGLLAEEFAARLRRGEHPSLTEYTGRFPELADEIRELFPALAMMEQFKPELAERTGEFEESAIGASRPLERLGDYRILREVGRGGMGVVYEAEQESLGRHVALKVLLGHALNSPQTVLRFRREARSAARLHHTNIVPVFGVGEQDGAHYYVMQFIHGRGLDEVIHELKQLRRADFTLRPEAAPLGPQTDHLTGAASAADLARAFATGQFARTVTAAGDPWPDATPASKRTSAGPAPATQDLGQFEAVPVRAPERLARSDGERHRRPADSPAATKRSSRSELASLSGTSRHYWREVARVGVQVARALEYAHTQGILHRDIKPSNLLLDLQGAVWVADFGLAKAVADDNLTHTDDIVGTLRYMAPERFAGQADARSDIYGLGLTLYELLTLKSAFGATDRARLIRQVTDEEPSRPRQLVPEIPNDLETICLKCIEKQSSRRYGTAAELADDLDRWLEGRPIAARRVSSWERALKWAQRKPALASLLALSATSLLGGVITFGWYNIQLARALAEARYQQRRSEGSAYIANINLVRRAIEADDISTAFAGLNDVGPADRRGFEWHYLRRLCDYDLLGRWETGAPIESLVYSPDGRTIATGHGYSTDQGFDDRPGWVQVRDAETGRLILNFEAHRGPVFGLAFSPDGRFVATGGGDRKAKLWDARNGRPVRDLGEYPLEVNDVAFSKDGTRVAVASGSRIPPPGDLGLGFEPPGVVAVRDAATGVPVWRRDDPHGAVFSVAYTPDGSRLAWGGFTTLSVADPADGRVLVESAPSGGRPAFSPDGRWLLTYGNHVPSWIEYERADRGPLRVAAAYSRGSREGWSSGVSFQPPDGKTVALAFGFIRRDVSETHLHKARRRVVRIWDTRRNEPVFALMAHRSAIRGQRYRPTDGNRLATADADGVVLLWQPNRAKPAATTHTHPSIIRALALHPDNGQLAAAGEDGAIQIESPDPHRPRFVRRGHDAAALALVYSPDGRQLASGGQDATIRVGPPEAGAGSIVMTGHTGPVHGLAFRSDGRQLASASADGTVRLWDPNSGGPVRILKGHSGIVLGVAYSSNGQRLASVGGDGFVRLWDPVSGRPFSSWPTGAGVIHAVTFVGGNGRTLATAGADNVIHLWDADSGQSIRELRGHRSEVLALAYGGVGEARLFSAGKDGTVRLWDPNTGQEVISLAAHTDAVLSVAVSRDGRILATAGADRLVRLWDARTSPHVKERESDLGALDSFSDNPGH